MLSKEQYELVLATWASKKEHSKEEHLIYNVLRGLEPSTGFAPIVRNNKLRSNSDDPYNSYNAIVRRFNTVFNDGYTYAVNEKKSYEETFGIEFSTELKNALSVLVVKS